MKDEAKKQIKCAIYTRKSTSEGLDQDFTSLDAQRESCANYISSQKREGWTLLPDLYDDGGFTGANMDRPAMQKLLSDIKSGHINCVVVYKVDRLSRSLLDFVQVLELFENHSVSFVSVTQHFNTNSSMGRLTLNILLSFAQFEREIISDRVKDKMGAARKKGRWIGGIPVLGYDVDRENRKLIVNQEEAKLVNKIFDLYIQEQSIMKVTTTLNNQGFRTKRYVSKSGTVKGNIPFKNITIQSILKSPQYMGKVRYQNELYPAVQEPIVSEENFLKTQEILSQNCHAHTSKLRSKSLGLLNRILRCKCCNTTMTHTYSQKGKHRYRYYVCQNALKRGFEACPVKSISAPTIEDSVLEHLREIANCSSLPEELKDVSLINDPIWNTLFPQEKRRIIQLILKEVDYDAEKESLGITLNENGLKILKSQITTKKGDLNAVRV